MEVMRLKLYKVDNIADNYAQDGFSYRFHSDLENISCEFTDMETISNTNSSIYTSDTCNGTHELSTETWTTLYSGQGIIRYHV